jgi:hypothetical protein
VTVAAGTAAATTIPAKSAEIVGVDIDKPSPADAPATYLSCNGEAKPCHLIWQCRSFAQEIAVRGQGLSRGGDRDPFTCLAGADIRYCGRPIERSLAGGRPLLATSARWDSTHSD